MSVSKNLGRIGETGKVSSRDRGIGVSFAVTLAWIAMLNSLVLALGSFLKLLWVKFKFVFSKLVLISQSRDSQLLLVVLSELLICL